MSRPRRPSISIHDYPEDLNPFNDNGPTVQRSSYEVELRSNKEPKNKFWTFGRSKKKRSNSFSIKSTWNGIFGKRKEPEADRRTTITTVSTSYHNGFNGRPTPSPRVSKDTRDFEEAFDTFTRRKKYSMETSSHYGSNLTVNGDPARLYNGTPQDTTASILGELTPKPPARRFGQLSPRPNRDIPPLDYEGKEENEAARDDANDRASDETPVPTKRSGRKSLSKVSVLETQAEAENGAETSDLSVRDENENLADEYVFRRCSQDALRRSNVSINSCVSTTSGMSVFGRKKRKAPQPPQRRDATENVEKSVDASPTTESKVMEDIDIAKVTEDIQEMTKQSQNIDRTIDSTIREEPAEEKDGKVEQKDGKVEENIGRDVEIVGDVKVVDSVDEKAEASVDEETQENVGENRTDVSERSREPEHIVECEVSSPKEKIEVNEIRIERVVEDKLEIITDIDEVSDEDVDKVEIRNKSSSLSRNDSFSVKEQIEQIERQIKELEAKNVNNNSEVVDHAKVYEPSETRLSIQANRRSFFKNMVNGEANGVKIEIGKLPSEQKQIQLVKLTDPPVPVLGATEPVKVVELHISEPIKQVPEFVQDINVNPLPKPRRHSSNPTESVLAAVAERNSNLSKSRETRGDSL